jgi:nitric oxide reductase NorQ protein
MNVQFVDDGGRVVARGQIVRMTKKEILELTDAEAIRAGFENAEKLAEYAKQRVRGTTLVYVELGEVIPEAEKFESEFVDWGGFLPVLKKAYEAREFVLVIGPAGVGKTFMVQEFARLMNKNVYTMNFSLRTREAHLVGSKTVENGSVLFKEGLLVKSMREGAILYLDELNAAQPEVLVRLDEALDDRRQIVLKEDGGDLVKAHPEWWVVATINPLGYAGTQELPAQILSRFPVRLYIPYPPVEIELQIVEKRVGGLTAEQKLVIQKVLGVVFKIREEAKNGLLPYCPTVRETLAFARLLKAGMAPIQCAEHVYCDAYGIWGEKEKMLELFTSLLGR